jgi:nucleoside-diphosphate-sugar epimerase
VKGQSGEAYNIAGDDVLPLRDMAGILAGHNQKEIVFELPEQNEARGFSKVNNALLDCVKLNALGWQARYTLRDGLIRTVEILRNEQEEIQ